MVTESSQKVANKYYCEICDYGTSKTNNYKKHLMTTKHEQVTLCNKNVAKVAIEQNTDDISSYSCEICLKKYITRSGLWRHKKKCSPNETKHEPPAENTMALTSSHIDNHLIIELIKQNGEILKQLAEINVHRCKIEQTRFSNSNEDN
uniref:C2H2-type domain-containing protein n=1 Tax=viral metagenome TaxID=1070528 RepID=A0A6C0ATK4_9ZZZZ